MEYRFSGKTIEEAVENACRELNAEKGSFSYEVEDYPNKGFLGIGSKPAVIIIRKEDDLCLILTDYIKKLFELMDIGNYEISAEQDDSGCININIQGEDAGIFTRRQGEPLDSLQHLLSLYARKIIGKRVRVCVDINGYKKRTAEKLEAIAARAGRQVLKTHRKIVLNPMSSYQRRVVHFKLQNEENITTYSIGSEPNRRVVVAYTANKKETRPSVRDEEAED